MITFERDYRNDPIYVAIGQRDIELPQAVASLQIIARNAGSTILRDVTLTRAQLQDLSVAREVYTFTFFPSGHVDTITIEKYDINDVLISTNTIEHIDGKGVKRKMLVMAL